MSYRYFLPCFLLSLFLCAPLAAEDPWLDDVALLIGNAEREAYLQVPGEAERQEFIRRFWEVRDPFPQTGRNELQEAWTARMAEARQRWALDDDRSRALLLRGEPDTSFDASCPGAPLYEIWVYEPTFQVKHRSVLVFSLADGTAKLWQPGPDAPKLHPPSTEGCTKELLRESRWIFSLGDEQYRALVERTLARPRPNPRDWYTRLVAMPAQAPPAEEALAADLEVEYPARFEDNSVVRVMMTLPAESLAPPTHELLVTGQVLQDRGVLEDFRYTFQVDPRIASPFIPLVFERYLRPGLYKLRIKLVDLITKRFFLGERELSVPAFDPSMAASLDKLYKEADEALAASRPGIRLLRPADKLLAGSTRFEARVEGAVSQVAFLLDGRRIYTRTRPPYAVTLDLGDVPRLQKLAVEGLGAKGEVLARDELVLNSGAQRFAVRLLDPQPGKTYRDSLRARVQVEPPQGERIERVEVWFNEDRVATLYQPPYTQPILLPKGKEVGYVRAVAYLPDGRAAEDLVLLNTSAVPDAMAVRLVELFTTVLDVSGRPVQSVEPGIFSVLEDGVPQKVRIVEPVGETPIRVVTLIDNSLSMRERLEQTREAALQFLQRTLRPMDQAAVITFNRTPRIAVRLTSDLEELREGLTGLLAEDQTSLYDSLAYGLQYLSGVKGQRAVLLLSDGMDRSSRLTFEQSLECARRAGIAVYTIGLGLPEGAKGEAGDKLHRMAAETGGRSYFVESTAELDGVYQQIERELRSQYRISYQSSNNSPKDGFRAVRVEVARKGMEARTISGYYP
ncbi:MAG TPA: VWA domain-containing protein [Thermoanaerobaculia bacterium]|nr:VWA domain-containing protein [Thermoanaerobaculia bacterium]